MNKVFVDTNIWLYGFIESQDQEKNVKAKNLILNQELIVISNQIIAEVSVNLLKKSNLVEKDLQQLILSFYDNYHVVSIQEAEYLKASALREKFSLSFWDSFIIATALISDCTTLFTEDLSHLQVFEGKLTIKNPFI
ncbi:MAG: PIN domain-containing protein [Microscillaceae bacterium]|nr:PIN domain-containing protein [Microscillaceae bacterium]